MPQAQGFCGSHDALDLLRTLQKNSERMITDFKTNDQVVGSMLKLVEITCMIRAPTVRSTFARPPEKGVPPTTTAIASNSLTPTLLGSPMLSLAVSTSPPARKQGANHMTMYFTIRTDARKPCGSSLPPTATR